MMTATEHMGVRLQSVNNLRYQLEASLQSAEATMKTMEERLSVRIAKEASVEAFEKIKVENQTLVEALRQAQSSNKSKDKEITALTQQLSKLQAETRHQQTMVAEMRQAMSERQEREQDYLRLQEEHELLQLRFLLLEEETKRVRDTSLSGQTTSYVPQSVRRTTHSFRSGLSDTRGVGVAKSHTSTTSLLSSPRSAIQQRPSMKTVDALPRFPLTSAENWPGSLIDGSKADIFFLYSSPFQHCVVD
jgi:myosin heavy subunit